MIHFEVTHFRSDLFRSGLTILKWISKWSFSERIIFGVIFFEVDHFRSDLFSKWPIREVVNFEVTYSTKWSAKWIIFGVISSLWPHFEVISFKMTDFPKWPTFEMAHLRSGQFHEVTYLMKKSILKWPWLYFLSIL